MQFYVRSLIARQTYHELLKGEQLGLFGDLVPVKAHLRKDKGRIVQVHEHQRHVEHAAPPPPAPPPAPPATDEPTVREFDVRLDRLGQFRARFAELVKRAEKLELDPPKMELVGERFKRTHKVPDWDNDVTGRAMREVTLAYQTVRLTAPSFRLPGGWKLLGMATKGEEDTKSGGRMRVQAFTRELLPQRYQQGGTHCDHCRLDRNRNQVFILRNEQGQWKQVGGECAKDYLGRSASSAAAAAGALDDFFDKPAEWVSGWDQEVGERGSEYHTLLPLHSTVAGLIADGRVTEQREREWLRSHEDLRHFSATPGNLWAPVTDADRAEATELIKWMGQQPAFDLDAEGNQVVGRHEHAWRELADSGEVLTSRFADIHGASRARAREQAAALRVERIERAKALGPLGPENAVVADKLSAAQKRDGRAQVAPFHAVVVDHHDFTNDWGVTRKITMVTDDGHLVTWWVAGPAAVLDPSAKDWKGGRYAERGDHVYVHRATVKGPDDYSSRNQWDRAPVTAILRATVQLTGGPEHAYEVERYEEGGRHKAAPIPPRRPRTDLSAKAPVGDQGAPLPKLRGTSRAKASRLYGALSRAADIERATRTAGRTVSPVFVARRDAIEAAYDALPEEARWQAEDEHAKADRRRRQELQKGGALVFRISVPALIALLKGEQLSLFGGGPTGPGRATVHQHMRRTKTGTTIVTQHERETPGRQAEPPPAPRTPPALEPPPAAPEPEPEPAGHQDVGEKVGGARKDTWHRIDLANIADVEALGDVEANRLVTKDRVWGTFDPAAQRGMGDSSGCAFLKAEIVKLIATRPEANARGAYVAACDWLQHTLDRFHTAAEVSAFLDEWRELIGNGDKPVTKPMTGEELFAALGIQPGVDDAVSYADAGGGWVHVTVNGVRHKITNRRMRENGYAGIRWDNTGRMVLTAKDTERRNLWGAYAAALGPRMVQAVVPGTRRSREIVPIRGKHRYTARELDKSGDWSWAGTDTGKDKPKQAARWQRELAHQKRVGGPKVDGEFTGERLLEQFGFRGVEYGNYVSQENRGEHIQHAVEAFTDLADVLGLDPKQLAHHGRLAVAFGARGKGWGKAHYEPQKRVINLTRDNGNGSLAHEWGHFMDHMITEDIDATVIEEAGRYRFKYATRDGSPRPEVQEAISEVMATIRGEDMSQEALELKRQRRELGDMQKMGRRVTPTAAQHDEWNRKLAAYNESVKDYNQRFRAQGRRNKPTKFLADAQALGSYWERPHELFARAWESFVEDELAAKGRRSPYLVDGTRTLYRLRKKSDAEHEPYPQGEEREKINAAMRKLVNALHSTSVLEKAVVKFLINADLAKAGTKGMHIKDRPGLVLDRMKHRWVRAHPDEKGPRRSPAQEGQDGEGGKGPRVKFTGHDGAAVEGHVMGGGARGVSVRDDRGGVHQVDHGEYTKVHGGARENQGGQEGRKSQGGGSAARDSAAPAKPAEGATTSSKLADGTTIHDEPMPDIGDPKAFNGKTKMDRAEQTADWSVVKKEMDTRFPPREYDATSHASALSDARAHMAELAQAGWVGKANLPHGHAILDTLSKHLEAAGASPEDAAEILETATRKLTHQEIEATRRTLGDHGFRHLARNVKQLDAVFDALHAGGKEISPKQRAAGTLAMVTHDLGYAIPAIARGGFKVSDNYHPQASFVLWRQETKANDVYNRVLGPDLVKTIGAMVVNHSGSYIDWEHKPMGTAMRLADNTHLFADKMPEILFDRPGAMELFVKLHLAQKVGADVAPLKAALAKHIEGRDDISPPQKTALLQAAKEIGGMTAKFLVSRLAGRDISLKYDGASKTMTASMEQSPLREAIGRTFGNDHKDKQFVKMLEDFGHSPEGILEGTPPPSATLQGKGGSSIKMQWTPPSSKPTAMEAQYKATMRRVSREWQAVQATPEGKQRDAATRGFWSKLAKAARLMIRAGAPPDKGKQGKGKQGQDEGGRVAEHVLGARVRFPRS